MATEALLYEHDDGRYAVSPGPEAAIFSHDDPAWHRLGPVDLSALAVPPVEQQAARATVYIQRDHLEKAKRAPFLCRVEPTQRLPDFVPMRPTEQPSQDAGQKGDR